MISTGSAMTDDTLPRISDVDVKKAGIRLVRMMIATENRKMLPKSHNDASVMGIAGIALVDILFDIVKEKNLCDDLPKLVGAIDGFRFPNEDVVQDGVWDDPVEEDVEMYGLMLREPALQAIGDAQAGISDDVSVCLALGYGAVGCLLGVCSPTVARAKVRERLVGLARYHGHAFQSLSVH